MTVTAKFKVTNRQPFASNDGTVITLLVDYTDERNKAWSPYTPAGSISLTITNKVAEDAFQLGDNFLVEFTREDQ